MRIVERNVMPDVATVYVACVRDEKKSLIEFVDGLDPTQPRENKWIINVSTQIGCPVNCLFCDAGGGFRGNLTADEMLAQVRAVAAMHPALTPVCRKLKVHFARMGEPSLNDDVPVAIERLPRELPAPGLWCCVPTVAPAGRDNWFARLAEIRHRLYPGRFQLQLSVNSTDEAQRRRLMPIELLTMDRLATFDRDHFREGDRKIVLNFALAVDVTFSPRAVIERFDPACFAVKLTPLNPTAAGERHRLQTVLRADDSQIVDEAVQPLVAAGFETILSIGDERENRVGSNCGQSVRRYLARTQQTS
ncbi:MAG TPA: radical SAM protein [bacterium]|nr:radical SAM protein [bacterium]